VGKVGAGDTAIITYEMIYVMAYKTKKRKKAPRKALFCWYFGGPEDMPTQTV